MKQLKRLNLKSSTTLETNEMKFILGGSTTTKGNNCMQNCSGSCVTTNGFAGTCMKIEGTLLCSCYSTSGSTVTASPTSIF